MRGKVLRGFRATLVAGLVVSVPAIATFLAVRFLFRSLDGLLGPVLASLVGRQVPGLGLLATIALVLLAGLLARSYVGGRLVALTDKAVSQVPVMRSVYRAAREIVETATLSKRQVFREAVLIEYPRKGLYSYGFVTGYTRRMGAGQPQRLAHVFIPGPPVPTTGVLIAVPADEIIPLDLSVEDALKLVLSGGMVTPDELRARERSGDEAAISR